MLIGAVSAVDAGLEDTAAQVAVVQAGEDGLLRGVDDDDTVGGLAAAALGVLLTLGDVGLGEACQFLFRLHPHGGIVGGSLQGVAPLLLQVGDAQVDLLHLGGILVREQRTGTDKPLVGLLEQFPVFSLQRLVLVVVDGLDTLEEGLVEHHLVVQVGQQRRDFLLGLGYLRRLVGTDQCVEHVGHTLQQTAALLVGHDGVLEGGSLLVVGDGLDVSPFLLDGSLDSRHIVAGLDTTEVRGTIGQRALLEQRVAAGLTVLACRHLQHQGRCHAQCNQCLRQFHKLSIVYWLLFNV